MSVSEIQFKGTIFEINRIKILNKKNGRSRPDKIIPCQFCGNRMDCGHKKIRVKGVNWKQYVPEKQYCGPQPCGKSVQNFRSRLTKKLLYPKNSDEYLTAQYCMWKMLARTPIKYLAPILSEGFKTEIAIKVK